MTQNTAQQNGLDREESKNELKNDSSTDIYFFRRFPRHIFSEPDMDCECGGDENLCRCFASGSNILPSSELVSVCRCLLPSSSSILIPKRKLRVLTTVARTEDYLTKKRIPQLLRWLVTKVVAEAPKKPAPYLEFLLNKLMLFRAGVGIAPVLYEDRHIKAMIKSFDPGNRGWMSSGQVKRLYATMGIEISPPKDLEDKISTDEVFRMVKTDQADELYALITAGDEKPEPLIPPSDSVIQKSTNYDDLFAGMTSDHMKTSLNLEHVTSN